MIVREEKGKRTNLVENEDELFASTVERFQFALDGAAPRSDGITRVQHLDNDVTHFEDLAQTLGVQLERRVLDQLLVIVLVHLFVVERRIGRDGGGECGGRSERRRSTVPLGFPTSNLLLLELPNECQRTNVRNERESYSPVASRRLPRRELDLCKENCWGCPALSVCLSQSEGD